MQRNELKLFKYCAKNGVEILGSGQIRLSPPNAFNDPFEFSVITDYSSVTKEKLKRYLKRPEWFADWYQIYRRGQGIEEALQYYHSNLDKIVDERMAELTQNVGREDANSCNTASRHWLVGCFAQRKDVILMWSHYADYHRGMVIEFDTNHGPFNRPDVLFLLKVRYGRKKPVFQYRLGMAGFEKQFRKMARYKDERWRYEQEWRIICPRNKLSTDPYLPIPHRAVSSVTLGCLCPEQVQITVHSLLRQPEFRHVSLYKAIMNRRKYKLEFNELRRGLS